MKYRNKRTGAVIEVSSVISGENWEQVKGKSGKGENSSPTSKRTARKAKERQDG